MGHAVGRPRGFLHNLGPRAVITAVGSGTQDSIHRRGQNQSASTIDQLWYEKKPSVSGRSAECAAFISEFGVVVRE